jgi:hypothetical protein
MGDLKTRGWRSPAPQSEKKLFLSVNYLTPVDRYLNDAAERRRIGRPSDECRTTPPMAALLMGHDGRACGGLTGLPIAV